MISSSKISTQIHSFAKAVVVLLTVIASIVCSEGRVRPRSGEPIEGDALHQLDTALKTLTARVSPAVVEVLVSGFGGDSDDSGNTAVVSRQQSVGSGVIVDPSGYIITNAHV